MGMGPVWTTRAEQSSSRSQKVATHYETSSGHHWVLVPWFIKKKKYINTCYIDRDHSFLLQIFLNASLPNSTAHRGKFSAYSNNNY